METSGENVPPPVLSFDEVIFLDSTCVLDGVGIDAGAGAGAGDGAGAGAGFGASSGRRNPMFVVLNNTVLNNIPY